MITFRRSVIAACGLLSVVAAGSTGEAAHQINRIKRLNTFNCSNPAFYDGHSGWCNTAYRVGYVKALPTAERMEEVRQEAMRRKEEKNARAQAYVEQIGAQQITTYRDTQTPQEDHNQVLVMQTPDDMRHSPPSNNFLSGWYANVGADWGLKHPRVMALATPQEHRIAQRPIVETTRTVVIKTRRYVEGQQN